MERQWELAKRKHSMDDHQNLHLRRHGGMIEKMWEEQAFAEDTLGAVGGSVWPPRSYSCSFCRREFRSAQALGGHMNVHRRDRARLKQSIPSDVPPGITYHHNSSVKSIPLHTNHMRTSTSLPATTNSSTKPDIQQFPLPVSPIIFNPNPIFTRGDPNPNLLTTPPYSHNKTFHRGDVQTFPHDSNTSSSLMLQEKSTKYLNDNSLNPSTQIYSRSKLGGSTNRYYSITNHIQKHPLSDESTTVESGGSCMVKRSYENAKTDLSVSLNLVLCRSCPRTLSGSYNDGKGDDRDLVMMSSCKRIKISGDADAHQTVSPCPVEELDLELRIGVGPHEVKY